MHTLAGGIVNSILRAAPLSVEHGDHAGTSINHPFVTNLEAGRAVRRRDILHQIGSGQYIVIAPLPVGRPATLKSLKRAGTDQMEQVSLRFQIQDNFGSPDINTSRHTRYEGHETIVDGSTNLTFKRSNDYSIRLGELFRPVAGETTAVESQFRFGCQGQHLTITIICAYHVTSLL